jgi:molecular chaperone GrpE
MSDSTIHSKDETSQLGPDPVAPEAGSPGASQPQRAEEAAAGEPTLEERLAKALAQAEEQRDTALRALAEADNTRKRAQAEVAAAHRYGVERFAENLLPVVDSLEAALAAAAGADEALKGGVELTLKQLKSAFEKANVAEIAPAPGERFDPHRHQAMAAVESDAEPNSVVAVMQKGYALHDRVIRPALVSVAKARPANDA